ncbi:MAG: SDR family oxidoreductase [Rhodobacteraceae bacterium]|nr:SDR family oxidoreductase [Paracoccaceae bacterium]
MTDVPRIFAPYFPVRSKQDRSKHHRILITGGAGFLGSNLCERLLAAGHRVICLDNLLTGRLENIAHLRTHPNFAFVKHDVIVPFDIDGRLERIYNLACPASPPKYQLDPIHTFQTSVIGAMNVLELARRKGARILQASTSEVYGDPEISPQPESYRGQVNTFGPRACYDEGKRAAETLFHDHFHAHGTDIRIMRIFNTYGPRMDPNDGRVVSNFVMQALQGVPITLYGAGLQTRSLCYVDDLLDGMQALMENNDIGPAPVNLGNPVEFSVAQIAQVVCEMTGSRSKLIHCDLPVDDPRQRRPDITRARTLLNWQPKVDLRTGLVPTIAYFQSQLLGQPAAQEAAFA